MRGEQTSERQTVLVTIQGHGSKTTRSRQAVVALAIMLMTPVLVVQRADAAAPTQGLVGDWKLDEESGTIAADRSGTGLNGALSGTGVTWATGKTGGGLTFNGSSGQATVANASAISFTGSFSLAAWIKPSALSGYQTVLHKGSSTGCSYWLQTAGNQISGGISTSSSCNSFNEHRTTTANLAVNTWYHVSVVFDSAATSFKIYLNGNLILNQTESARPVVISEALVFGQSSCSSCGFERWRGVMDGIRLYNRALSAQDALDVYNDAGSTGDTQAPATPSNLTATPVSSTQINLGWSASPDNVGVTGYRVYRNATPVGTSGIARYSDTGLNASTTYTYAVAAFDAAGNQSSLSSAVSAATPAPALDTQAPTVGLTAPAAGAIVTGTTVTVSATATDSVGVTAVQFLLDGQPLGAPDASSPFSITWDTTLTAGGSHTLSATARDAAGNQATSTSITVTVQNVIDDESPSTPTGVTANAISANSILVNWPASTDNVGVTGYYVYRYQGGTLRATLITTSPSATDSGLTPVTTYSYGVAAHDASGNLSTASEAVSATTQAVARVRYPLRFSSDGRYLVDQNNQPFFINGETAWSLIAQPSDADAGLYLENRRQKGFNAVLVNLIEHQFATHAPANHYHDRPFTKSGDFSTPNDDYFAHADSVISHAAAQGILVLLDPLYLGYGCGQEGWCAEVMNSSSATLQNWGAYVGHRYKNFPNIIWVVGGDTDPASNGVASKVEAFVSGLKSADTTHLVTAHNAPEESALAAWPTATWLNLNNVYTYGYTYQAAITEYSRSAFKPFFLIENAYENERHSTPLSLRSEAYWTILSGGVLGHFFGNCPLWGFGAADSFCSSSSSWQSELDSVGSTTLALVGRLFNSRAFYTLVPDLDHSVLTSGYQSGSTYATAARMSDGSSIVAYIPTGRTVTIDLTKIFAASAAAWWYDPRTGSATSSGTFATTGSHAFTPPDTNDWVLVIDDASLNLSPPGR
jgi:chitodextrinase